MEQASRRARSLSRAYASMRWFVKETRSLASGAGDDILEANVVILADGVNSMLAARWEWFPLPIRIITLLVLKR